MPAQIFPLLGAAARTLGTRALARLSVRGASAAGVGRRGFDIAALARQLGTPNPSDEQVSAAVRQQNMDELRRAALGASKALMTIPTLGVAITSASGAAELFGKVLLSHREQLAMFDAGTSAAFARIRRQDLELGIRTAAGTSGTTQGLANSFMALREDVQPIKEAMQNIMNVGGMTLLNFARLLVMAAEAIGYVALLEKINELLQRWFGQADPEGVQVILKDQLTILGKLEAKTPDANKNKGNQPQAKEPAGFKWPGIIPEGGDFIPGP